MSGFRILGELPTPALLLDGPAARRNIATAAALIGKTSARLRPHFKSHKCVPLAREQMAGGNCLGMTAATLDEAEALLGGGIDDILIANQIVGRAKVARLVRLAGRARIRTAVDSIDNAEPIAAAARRAGLTIDILLEIEMGRNRWGVEPGEPALAMARRISSLPGLRLDGLQAYHGSGGHLATAEERAAYARATTEKAAATKELFAANGLPCPIVSGAGTGTFQAILNPGVMTELQLGTYVVMDWVFQERLGPLFEPALSVLATVISATGDRFIVDVGVKGLGNKLGPPRLPGLRDYEVAQYAAEEHTIVRSPGHGLRVGDQLRLIPSHAGGTAPLYRQFVVHDAERILDLWPISATGYDLTAYSQ